MMPDAAHFFGGDLQVSATGDILMVDGPVLTQQRLLRRLLTNQGDYIWQLDYGAGLGAFVGKPANAARIGAVIRNQVLLEPTVARVPVPTVSVAVQPTGVVTATVRYADAVTGTSQVLSFPLGG